MNMNRTGTNRSVVVCCALVGAFSVCSWRLTDLQITRHEALQKTARGMHCTETTLYAKRGRLMDAKGQVLAQSEPVKTVCVSPASVIDPEHREGLASVIAEQLKMDKSKVTATLLSTYVDKKTGEKKLAQSARVMTDVSESTALALKRALEEKKLTGVHYEQEFRRVYPNGKLASHVVGFVDNTEKGAAGVEMTMDHHLQGRNGVQYIERDAFGKEIAAYRGPEIEARHGNDVRLTVDLGLQDIVESEMDAAWDEWHPIAISVVMIRPQTGEVLAMASRPTFDLRDVAASKPEDRRNRAITDPYEPGSTFKIVANTAIFEEGLATPETRIFCENGFWKYAQLKDSHSCGWLTARDCLVQSSNIGFAKFATQLGDQKLWSYARKFGIGQRTGIALPYESPGVLASPARWTGKMSLTRIAIGHEVMATPLQLVTAISAVANGGKLMLPQLAREITDSNGALQYTFTPQEVRTVGGDRSMKWLRDSLELVTDRSAHGTAGAARVSGFRVAGKTGTTQKPVKDANGRISYSSRKHICTFIGYMPAEAPEFAMVVSVDEPKAKKDVSTAGGTVAAPLFSKIAARAAGYLNLIPSEALLAKKGKK